MTSTQRDLRCYEDLAVGEQFDLGSRTVGKAEIFEFARDFDPQRFHLDPAVAAESLLGGVAASGWHTASILMRLFHDGWLLGVDGHGSPGVSRFAWKSPLHAGDTVCAVGEITGLRPLRSLPGFGMAEIGFVMNGSAGGEIAFSTWNVLIGMREAGEESPPGTKRKPPKPGPQPSDARPADSRMFYLDTCPLGERIDLGEVGISREEILRFARAFDPQPFHVDEAAARATHFGGLIASGWHSCALWMRANVHTRQRLLDAMPATERDLATHSAGIGLGFEDLIWPAPVRPGDRLHAYITACERTESKSRPDWGRIRARAELVNQSGALVVRFFPTLLLRRAPSLS